MSQSLESIIHSIDRSTQLSIGSIDHPIDRDRSIGSIDHLIDRDRSSDRRINILSDRSIGSIDHPIDRDR
jgi:hypothetical protein